jgi:hypothetical protein
METENPFRSLERMRLQCRRWRTQEGDFVMAEFWSVVFASEIKKWSAGKWNVASNQYVIV